MRPLALLLVAACSTASRAAPALAAPHPAPSTTRSRLLVVYVAGRDAVSTQRAAGVHSLWRGMQTEYTRWSLRCLFVYGGLSAADDARGGGRGFAYASDRTCPSLSLPSDDSYEGLGHKVKDMIVWVAGHITAYDYLLKTDVDTLICFNMVTDMIDAVARRYATSKSIYLGHFDTCSKITHFALDRFYDPHYMEDLLFREDANCYPPYMQVQQHSYDETHNETSHEHSTLHCTLRR